MMYLRQSEEQRASQNASRPIGVSLDFPSPDCTVLSSAEPYLRGECARETLPTFALSVDSVHVDPLVRQIGDDPTANFQRFEIPLFAFFDKFDDEQHEIVLTFESEGRHRTLRLLPTWKREGVIRLVAMDTTNTCNLRCAFCCEDQDWRSTVLDAPLLHRVRTELLPLVTGTILLSCLNEPFLNKKFHLLCESLPESLASKAMFTSNMTVPLSDEKIGAIARSRLRNVNVSLDSSDPAVFELMRANGRFEIFEDNLTRLADALKTNDNEMLRFSAVITRRNFRSLPETIEWAMRFRPVEFELRSLFFGPHWINPRWDPADGRLNPQEVDWLRAEVQRVSEAQQIRHVFHYDHDDLEGLQTPSGHEAPEQFPLKNRPTPPEDPGERRAQFDEECDERDRRISRLTSADALSFLENMLVRVRAEGRVHLNDLGPSYIREYDDLGQAAFEHMSSLAKQLRASLRSASAA
jgi:MoaA/NifB/PqqE/SkfB family radical SAM enzyme